MEHLQSLVWRWTACVWWEMKTEKCFGLTKGSFQGDEGQQWDSGVPAAHSLPDHWVTRLLFLLVYRFGKSEHLHLSSILDREKIADNGNKNTSKHWKCPAQIVLCQQLCNLYK